MCWGEVDGPHSNGQSLHTGLAEQPGCSSERWGGKQGPASSSDALCRVPEARSPGSAQPPHSPSSHEMPHGLTLSITFSLSGCSSLHLLTPLDDHMAPSHFLHFITVSSMDHFMPLRPPNFCCVAEGLLELTSRLAGSPPFLTCTFSPNTSFSFCCFSSCWLRISYLGNVFCEKPR